jgi:hypothetical protein
MTKLNDDELGQAAKAAAELQSVFAPLQSSEMSDFLVPSQVLGVDIVIFRR